MWSLREKSNCKEDSLYNEIRRYLDGKFKYFQERNAKEDRDMTDSLELDISFNEHERTEEWETRKYRIALFVIECWRDYFKDIDSIWKDVDDLIKNGDSTFEIFERYAFSEEDEQVYIVDYEYYGNAGRAAQTMNDGMKKYFPDIDYYFDCTENGGDAYYSEIYKVANGVLTHESIRYTDEEDLDEEDSTDEEDDE